MLTTIERPKEKPFNQRLYFLCVQEAARMSQEELSNYVDKLLSHILKDPDDTPDSIKEQAAIFAYLSLRRKQ